MKINTYIVLPIVMLMSVPVVAVENTQQGAAQPPFELNYSNSLNMSGSLSANTNYINPAAQAATANAVDKTDIYIPNPDQAAPQQ
jgi:hypothetical protein